MKIEEYEIARRIKYTPFENNGRQYLMSDYPYLDIVLNDVCNKKCKFCIADLIDKKQTCDINKHKERIHWAIRKLGIREVLIVGGEVTIKPMDSILFEILEFLKDYTLEKICLTTNGLRLATDNQYLWRISKSNLTHINLSFMNFNEGISYTHLANMSYELRRNNIHLRINNNVYKGNNDNLSDIVKFYSDVSCFCDSIKFSPLLKTDAFSVKNAVTEWVKEHILTDTEYDKLWSEIENKYSNFPLLINNETFGFVKYSMILKEVPIILNYNQHGKLREKVINEGKINNIKLLSNSKLSLSWNKDEEEYIIK